MDELVSVVTLTEENEREREAAIEQESLQIIRRWINVLTKKHLEEKIKEALTSRNEHAILVDEMIPQSLINPYNLYYCVHPSMTTNVRDHIESLLATNGGTRVSCTVEQGNRIVITLFWGNGYLKHMASELSALGGCATWFFCCSLCCNTHH